MLEANAPLNVMIHFTLIDVVIIKSGGCDHINAYVDNDLVGNMI